MRGTAVRKKDMQQKYASHCHRLPSTVNIYDHVVPSVHLLVWSNVLA